MRELSLFSGAGGGLLGTYLLGWTPIGYVEINEYCQKVIAARIKDGILHEAPIFSNIRTFISEGYARRYRGMVDVITAGFPCQPFSQAGKQLAERDKRNMWPETAETISIIQPQYTLLENVPGIISTKYIERVFRDLAQMDYNAISIPLSARSVGAYHKRERQWILATNTRQKRIQGSGTQTIYKLPRIPWGKDIRSLEELRRRPDIPNPLFCGMVDGVAHWMDRLKAIGNGQVPAVVAKVWELLID